MAQFVASYIHCRQMFLYLLLCCYLFVRSIGRLGTILVRCSYTTVLLILYFIYFSNRANVHVCRVKYES